MNTKKHSSLTMVSRVLPWAGLLALSAIAMVRGIQITADAEWPYAFDAMRDIGVAQSILNGAYPEDPNFLGESLWYNPLVGALAALGSRLTGLPAHTVDARLGAYLNVSLLITFFLLAATWFDPWVALAALVFFLFGNAAWQPIWITATYTPVLFAPHLAQAFFYMAIVLYWRAQRSNTPGGYVLLGLCWGIMFMAHAGPAIILGGILVLLTAGKVLFPNAGGAASISRSRAVGYLSVAAAVAFLASLPYTYSILRDYQFQIRNPAPTWYIEPLLSTSNFWTTVRQACTPYSALACMGIILLMASAGNRPVRNFVLCWLAVLGVLIAHVFAWQILWLMRWNIPLLVPGHHYLISLAAAKALLAGYACIAISRYVIRRWIARVPNGMAAAVTVAVLCAWLYPSFAASKEFTARPRDRLPYAATFDDVVRTYEWVMASTVPEDVFLCDDQLGLVVVGPAARKYVCTLTLYTNLYTDSAARMADREAFFDCLRAKDEGRFRALADKYHVKYVVVRDREEVLVRESGFDFLTEVFRSGPLKVYQMAT